MPPPNEPASRHAPLTSPAPPAELLGAIARWQARDGTYRAIQRVTRSRTTTRPTAHDATLGRLSAQIATAIYSGRTRQQVTVFRGVRRVDLALGPDLSPRTRHTLAGFTATTTRPEVTLEFIPNGGTLLAIDVPEGTPALDVGSYGDPAIAQHELLLPDGIAIELGEQDVGSSYSTDQRLASTMVIRARVLNDRTLY